MRTARSSSDRTRLPFAWGFCPNKAGKTLFQEICHSSKRFKRPWHCQFYVELLRQVCCLSQTCLGGCKGYFRPSLRMAKASWVTQVPGPTRIANASCHFSRALRQLPRSCSCQARRCCRSGRFSCMGIVKASRSHPRKESMLVCNRLLGQSRVRATNLPNARGWTLWGAHVNDAHGHLPGRPPNCGCQWSGLGVRHAMPSTAGCQWSGLGVRDIARHACRGTVLSPLRLQRVKVLSMQRRWWSEDFWVYFIVKLLDLSGNFLLGPMKTLANQGWKFLYPGLKLRQPGVEVFFSVFCCQQKKNESGVEV